VKNIIFTTLLAALAISTVSAQNQGTKRKNKTHKKSKSSHKKKLNKTQTLAAYILNCGRKYKDEYTPDSSYAPENIDLVALIKDPAININASSKIKDLKHTGIFGDTGNTILMNAIVMLQFFNRQCKENLTKEVVFAGLDHPHLKINQTNNKGETLLMLATREVDWPKTNTKKELFHAIFDKILTKKPNLNLKDQDGNDALVFALQSVEDRDPFVAMDYSPTPVKDTYYLTKLLTAGAYVDRLHIKLAMNYVKVARQNMQKYEKLDSNGLLQESRELKKANFVLTLLISKQKEQAKGHKKNRTK
jgi:hypothetical protein